MTKPAAPKGLASDVKRLVDTYVEGGATGALVAKKAGVYIPDGALDRYRAALPACLAGTRRGEIPYFGDSTGWGQDTSVTNTTTGAGRYPVTGKLRALAKAAGFPDGGTGIVGTRGGLGTTGADQLAVEVSRVGDWGTGGEGYYSPLRQYGYKCLSNQVGDQLVVQLKVPVGGGSIRINHTTGFPANVASWSYKVDAGSAVPIAAQTATRKTKTYTITGLAAGVRTITIAITTAGVAAPAGNEWTFECLGNGGLVFQNYSISGAKASGRFDISAVNGFQQEAFGLGYWEDAVASGTAVPYMVNAARAGTPRDVILAIHALGINDQQLGTGSGGAFATDAEAQTAITKVATSIGSFAESIREVCDGVVVIPHLAWSANPQWSGAFRNAILSAALSYGLAVIDYQAALGGRGANFSTYGGGAHLSPAGYDVVAQFLWDNALAPVA